MSAMDRPLLVMKRCPRGNNGEGHALPATEQYFHKCAKSKDGLHAYCKPCLTAYQRGRYAAKHRQSSSVAP